ncbi:MAG: flagellar biosynthesis protein FlhB [Thermodesulfovibrionales bacterium]
MAEEFQERTEQATPRRRQKAREKGQVPRSRELSSMASLGGMLLVFYFGASGVVKGMTGMTGRFLGLQYGVEPLSALRAAAWEGMFFMLPLFGAAFVFALGASVAQGGFVLKPFEPSLEKINPAEGIKRIFSFSGLAEFLKSLLKFTIGGALFYYVIRKDMAVLPTLMEMDTWQLSSALASLVMKAVLYGFGCFLVVAAISYALERVRFERSLRMTREEIKEEFKETEGHPQVKSRIRSIQHELARKRMMQEVPKSTVVITNPVHLAVCLRYEDNMPAPRVVAKGSGHVAEKIKEVARKHGVPVVEDRPLARLLFKLDMGAFIPEELYKAVARILAHIYKLQGKA